MRYSMYRLRGVTLDAHEIKRHVVEHYGSRATAKSCCTTPRGGCLAPLAEIAAAREGDIVVDIGSGPGFDVCAFSGSVGEKGRVIGLDLSKEMIEVQAQALRYRDQTEVEGYGIYDALISANKPGNG
jgi:SAM-dependent methyltransferase